MDQPSHDAPLDWLHFIRRSGREGSRWAQAYCGHLALAGLCQEALMLFRRRRFTEGHAVLERAAAEREALADVDASIRSVIDRWYYGVLGYAFYTADAFDDADRTMDQAYSAVADAVQRESFLIPLAYHCHEFYLHRARIARNRMRWSEMRELVAEVRGMMEGRVPLCTLTDGRPVWISSVQDFYRSLAPFSDIEAAACRVLLDDEARLRGFDRFVHAMYQIPGAVISYP